MFMNELLMIVLLVDEVDESGYLLMLVNNNGKVLVHMEAYECL